MASQHLPCLFVICDNAILSIGYQTLVASSARIRLVGEGSHDTTVEEVRRVGTNILAIDTSTIDRRGLRTAERFKTRCPDLPVVLLSVDGWISDKHVQTVGADGYISLGDTISDGEFVTAVIEQLDRGPGREVSPRDEPELE